MIPLQRADIARMCRRRGLSLEALADELVYLQCTGVPPDQAPIISRAWQLVTDLLAERRDRHFARDYTPLTTCPHCSADPVVTGGKHPVTYCPACGAQVCDAECRAGLIWRRWSPPTAERSRS